MFKYLIYFILILLFGACGDSGSPSQTVALEQSGLTQTQAPLRPVKKEMPHADENESATPPESEQHDNVKAALDMSWLSEAGSQAGDAGEVDLPYIAPESHAVMQTSFEAAESRIRLNGATLDTSMARSGRTSVHLAKSGDTLFIEDIPVSEGAWYVIHGYMYVNSLPASVVRYYVAYMHQGKQLDIPAYPMLSVSKAGAWEEFILPVYIKKDLNITDIRIVFRDVGSPDLESLQSGKVWIDDLSIQQVDGSDILYGVTKPSKKIAFEGKLVRVDALGNFALLHQGTYEPFLPVIIYPDNGSDQWRRYQQHGFNTVICNSPEEARKAVEAGMYWIWDLYGYGIYDNDESGLQRFVKEYQKLKKEAPSILKKLVYFYWDNERYRVFESLKKFTDTIKSIDRDPEGTRNRPIAMQLSFSTGSAHYSNTAYRLVDLQGLYANPMIFEDNDPVNYDGIMFKGDYDAEFANFAIFDHIPGVTIPKTVFVVNSPFGDKHLDNTIFAAFARGGKAFAYWKDGGSQPKIETKSWWTDFNQTAAKIQAMLPLLRQPHWTSWDLNVSMPDDEDGLVVGKRDFEEKRCMIIA
ncbi:MAG TPA: hypothetical protein ENL02_02790, partial [Epsilonproteobacteria bacterium]|nr:hypothetical protein [Campylobacterota bacterium]